MDMKSRAETFTRSSPLDSTARTVRQKPALPEGDPVCCQLIKKLLASVADQNALAQTHTDPNLIANDFFDYSKSVVRKPWGYEYLIFQNEFVAVWILYIQRWFQTSMHCHPNKKTSLTILSGDAICSTIEREVTRRAGDMMLIGKAVFHRTQSISDGGTFVMEIETPVNKRDLIRFKDAYGREHQGYETVDHMSFNLQNYNYTSFIDPQVYYNVKKRFGNSSIRLSKFSTLDELRELIESSEWDAVSVLKGAIFNDQGEALLDVGDTIVREDLRDPHHIRMNGEVEALILKKIDPTTRLSDFVVSYLSNNGLRDIFLVPGASNAHLIDAVGRDTEVRFLSLQTEHGATLAAESYAKVTGKPGVVIIDSGSSCTNALTGVANSWVDSVPCLVISGQSRPSELEVPEETSLRQLANKELDIASIVRPMTKYAATIRTPHAIKKELERAIHLCLEQRPGPTWLDIPIDILGSNIDETEFLPYVPDDLSGGDEDSTLRDQAIHVLELIGASQRPVILGGHGIRAARAQKEFVELAKSLSLPVLLSRRGVDLLPDDFPLYFGRPGRYGGRAANFVIQNSDLLISIGSRLSLPLIGRNHKAFARAAKKVVVDIDSHELRKPTLSIDLGINADASKFIRAMLRSLPAGTSFRRSEWIARCELWKSRFPPNQDADGLPVEGVNPYYFVEALSSAMNEDDILVVDGGVSLDYVMQAFRVKQGQRIISSPGLEYPGFALPGAIGAWVGSEGRRIVCLCEKKGLKLNIPELQTVVNNRIPIVAFVLNCQDDLRMQQVQTDYFGCRYVGCDGEGIIGSINVAKLGEAYEIPTGVIADHAQIRSGIENSLASEEPFICEVRLPAGQEIVPRLILTVKSDGKWIAKPIEDMYPFLDRDIFRDNMVIDVLEED